MQVPQVELSLATGLGEGEENHHPEKRSHAFRDHPDPVPVHKPTYLRGQNTQALQMQRVIQLVPRKKSETSRKLIRGCFEWHLNPKEKKEGKGRKEREGKKKNTPPRKTINTGVKLFLANLLCARSSFHSAAATTATSSSSSRTYPLGPAALCCFAEQIWACTRPRPAGAARRRDWEHSGRQLTKEIFNSRQEGRGRVGKVGGGTRVRVLLVASPAQLGPARSGLRCSGAPCPALPCHHRAGPPPPTAACARRKAEAAASHGWAGGCPGCARPPAHTQTHRGPGGRSSRESAGPGGAGGGLPRKTRRRRLPRKDWGGGGQGGGRMKPHLGIGGQRGGRCPRRRQGC